MPASIRITLASRVSMWRKSRASEKRAISAIAPAISTPVGPPPTTTKVISALRRAGSGSRSASSNDDQDAAADVERILQGLQTRRVWRPFVVAEIGVVRPGGEDQIVVREPSRILIEDDLLCRDIDRFDPGQDHLHVRLAAQHRPDRLRDVRRRKRGRRHLVEQGLKQVVIAPVDERDVHGRVGERLRRLQSAEPAADDDDTSAGVGIGGGRLPLSPERESNHGDWPRTNAQRDQWRKWRVPVKTIATPARSAAAITASSRIDPPG